MWNENLVIIVKGWDPRGGEGKFARHPHQQSGPLGVHQAQPPGRRPEPAANGGLAS